MSQPRRFFIAGAQRCGTSYLYRLFENHPEVFMAQPLRPEPKFFLLDDEYQRGMDYYFERYFEGAEGKPLWGEKSTSYLESEKAGRRIQRHFPDASILLILRNPVYRALSNYYFSVANGLETRELRAALMDGATLPELRRSVSVSPFHYLERGCYARYIERYRCIFGPRLHVLIAERVVGSLAAAQELYALLGIDTGHQPEIGKADEDSTGVDYAGAPDVVEYLREYYQGHNRQLEAMLGEDLGVWNTCAVPTP